MKARLSSHVSAVILLLVTLSSAVAADGSTTWKAGVARSIITPTTDVWLAGYGSKRVPDGKLHELWMKALALEDHNGRRAVLVTSDFQGVPKSMSDRVFANVLKQFGLERHQVIITFSHNHCGPRLGDDLTDYYPYELEQVRTVAEYTDTMVAGMTALIGQALEDLSPSVLVQSEGTCTFAVNRRNNREADVPAILARGEPLVGPVDHSVPVLQVNGVDGSRKAILFGYACHPTTLSFTKWCGDYPGFAQLAVEEALPGATAMFVNTCGGDQNPLPRREVSLCEDYGHRLATAVLDAVNTDAPEINCELHTAFEYTDLPYLNVVSQEELVQETSSGHPIRKRWAERMLKKLAYGEPFESAYPYPVHVWKLGQSASADSSQPSGADLLLIGLGAETVVDYALRFKLKYGHGTWVCGYADDMIAYIPSHRVWLEGGYEGGSNLFEYGRPAFRWADDIEDRIVTTVERLTTGQPAESGQ